MTEIISITNGFNVKVDGKEMSFPSNSVILYTDDSDMVLFRSVDNFDVLFSGLVEDITIDGETMTKETIGEKFASVANKATGGGEGGGGMTPEEKEELKNLRADMENALGDIAALDIDKQDDIKKLAKTGRTVGYWYSNGEKEETIVLYNQYTKDDILIGDYVNNGVCIGFYKNFPLFQSYSYGIYRMTTDTSMVKMDNGTLSELQKYNLLDLNNKFIDYFDEGKYYNLYLKPFVTRYVETNSIFVPNDRISLKINTKTSSSISNIFTTWNNEDYLLEPTYIYFDKDNGKVAYYRYFDEVEGSEKYVFLENENMNLNFPKFHNDLIETGNPECIQLANAMENVYFVSYRTTDTNATFSPSSGYNLKNNFKLSNTNTLLKAENPYPFLVTNLDNVANLVDRIQFFNRYEVELLNEIGITEDEVAYGTQYTMSKSSKNLDGFLYHFDGQYLKLGVYNIEGVDVYMPQYPNLVKFTDDNDLNSVKQELEAKQDKLTAGENITIEGNVISATGGGGDEHYKSEATEGMDDAPVITMKNGTLTHVIPDPYPSTDGYNLIYNCTDNFDTTPEMVFKRTDMRNNPYWYYNNFGYEQQQLATWNASENCLVFDAINEHVFEGNFYESTWYVNGEVIKEERSYKFKPNSKLHFTDNYEDSDVLKIVVVSRDEYWGNAFSLSYFGYIGKNDLEPFDRADYYTINDAMEVDYRGQKYHLIPKEQLKTINGQSIVGTGNLTVTDNSTKNYAGGSTISGEYYRIWSGIINNWNTAQDRASNYYSKVQGHFEYNSSSQEPASATKKVLVRDYVKDFATISYEGDDSNVFRSDSTLDSAKPIYIESIVNKGSAKEPFFYCNGGNIYYYVYVTVRNTLLFPDSVNKGFEYYNIKFYVSDTIDGEYTPMSKGTVDNEYDVFELEAGKWYKCIINDSYGHNSTYSLIEILDSNIYYTNYADVYVKYLTYVNSDIDNALYFQNGTEMTPILTERNYKKYIDIPSVWKGTQDEYDALGTYNDETVYYILED